MKRKVKKLKVNWPLVIAVALGVSLVSFHNEATVEKYKQEQSQIQTIDFDETFQESDFAINELGIETSNSLEEPQEIDLLGSNEDVFSK